MQITPSPYEKLTIETPENIELDYELAGPGSRFMAYMADYFIMNTAIGILVFILTYVSGVKITGIKDFYIFIILCIYFIFYVLGGYFIIFETIWSGQTPGKRFVGIRVVQDNGLPVTFTQVVFRNVMRLLDCNFPIQYGFGIAYMLSDKNNRRLGDVSANTLVVKDKKPFTMADALVEKPALTPQFDATEFYMTLPFDYQKITPTQAGMLQEFWDLKNNLPQDRTFVIISQLVPPILAHLNIEKLAKYQMTHIDYDTKMNGYYLFVRDALRALKYEELSPFYKYKK